VIYQWKLPPCKTKHFELRIHASLRVLSPRIMCYIVAARGNREALVLGGDKNGRVDKYTDEKPIWFGWKGRRPDWLLVLICSVVGYAVIFGLIWFLENYRTGHYSPQ
jgi:hypothetical protein